jgi:phage terminase large subunit
VSDALARAKQNIARWRRDPIAFARENFGFEPDAWQADALRAFGDQDQAKLRISLQACAGPGKSACLAICGWNFLSCYGDVGDHPKGAAVSITRDNLKDNLWAEFARWQHQPRAQWLREAFSWTHERIFAKDHPETWFLSARSWPKTANPEEQGATLSGLHSGYVLVLIDESGGIPVTVLKAGEQAFGSAKFARMLQAGNPISLEGILYAAATTLRELWHVIRITGDPDDPNRSPRIDIEWARQQITTYGRDDPWVRPYILGMFPEASINALLGVEEVQAAMHRHLRKDQYDWAQKRLGIDAARFGDDKWVIFPRQGLAAFKPVAMRHVRSQQISARVQLAKQRWGSQREFFDGSGGYAAGAIDDLIAAGYAPTEVSFSQSALDPRFYNARAEMLWNCAQWVKRGGALPNVPELVAEMTTPTYTFKSGRLIVEDKEQIKKRLGRSPNYFDALALTFAEPDMPADLVESERESRHARTEFDPHGDQDARTQRSTHVEYSEGMRRMVEEHEITRGHAVTDFDPNER